LDGTKPYILGLKNSVFMLGLSKGGEMQMSVVYDPYENRMYHAVRGEGAFCDGKPVYVSEQRIDEGIVLLGADSYQYAPLLKQAAIAVEPVSGTGFKCMMIATGRGTGMINAVADFHDIGPGSLIVEEAGGRVTGLQGERLDYRRDIGGVIVSNGAAHESLLAIAARTNHPV
jgi:myo-inositol-1(or 4)-monophosphatase